MNEYLSESSKIVKRSKTAQKLLNHPNRNFIKFDPIKHEYFYNKYGDFRKSKDTEKWNGITSIIGEYKQPFDREGISKGVAYRDGRTQDDVLAEWDKKRDDAIDYGNSVHDALDVLINNGEYREEHTDEIEGVLKILEDLELTPVCGEYVIFDDEIKRASPIDLICLDRFDRLVALDYKTPAKGIEFNGYKDTKMLYPLYNYPDSNYYHYSLQLNIYKDFMDRWGLNFSQESYILYVREKETLAYPPHNLDKEWKEIRKILTK